MNTEFHNKTKKYFPSLCLLLMTLLINACQVLRLNSSSVPLGDNTYYQLQPVPKDFYGQITLQKLTVTSAGNNHELLVQTELQQQQINMVGFSQSGMQLFELSWQQNGQLELTSNIILPDIQAEQLLAYYQLSNWPIDSVLTGLTGMQLKSPYKNTVIREFWANQQLIFSVKPNKSKSQMTHYRDHYKIEIENID